MNLSEFFAMGGHGFYIWGSYGTALLLMIAEAVWVSKRHKKAQIALKRMEQEFSSMNSQGIKE